MPLEPESIGTNRSMTGIGPLTEQVEGLRTEPELWEAGEDIGKGCPD